MNAYRSVCCVCLVCDTNDHNHQAEKKVLAQWFPPETKNTQGSVCCGMAVCDVVCVVT